MFPWRCGEQGADQRHPCVMSAFPRGKRVDTVARGCVCTSHVKVLGIRSTAARFAVQDCEICVYTGYARREVDFVLL